MIRAVLTLEQNWHATPGGTARSTNRLIEAFTRGADVRPVGMHGLHLLRPRLPLPELGDRIRVPVPGRLLVHSWDRMARPGIDRWLGDADLVHASAYMLPPTTRPLVVTIHDLAFRHDPSWFTPHGVRYLSRFLDRVLASDAEVIVPSAATAADCVDAGIDPQRLHVIPWGVEPARSTAESIAAVRARHSLPEHFILYVGTLEPRKNVATLTQAMADLPGVSLVIAGPDGWGDVPTGNARVLGELPEGEIPPLMAAADLLVYPSRFEGFGLPVLEAMAEGTPALVTAGTAPAEVGGDACITADTSAPALLRSAVAGALADRGELARLGRRAAERAADFDWRRTAERTVDVYREMIR